jgi:hypothetical protein
MLFRKLKLDWRYGLSELLIVVCGVLIALAAEGWRQDLQDRSAERDYVSRLRRDIEQDTAVLADLMALSQERAASAAAVLRVFDTGEAVGQPEDFVRAVSFAVWFNYPPYSRTTIEDLRTTGNLRLLRDVDAKETVSRYYAQIDFFGQFRDVFVPRQLALGEVIPGILGPTTQGAIFNEFISANCGLEGSCGSQIPWVPSSLTVTEEEAELVRRRLLARPDARELYADMQRIHGVHYSNLSDIRKLAVIALETLERYGEH